METAESLAQRSAETSLFTRGERALGEKYLKAEQVASRVLPRRYFDSVFEDHFAAWIRPEVGGWVGFMRHSEQVSVWLELN